MLDYLIRFSLKIFFHLLYNPFAWTYDAVSAIVSVNQWRQWILTVIPYIPHEQNPTKVLELGYGTANLMKALMENGYQVFGLDRSPNMAKLAKKRLQKFDLPIALCIGIAQQIPFQSHSFDCVVSTFPTRFIYEESTLREIKRVLVPSGRLVVVPQATIVNENLLDKAASWLFKITGQSSVWMQENEQPFRQVGFKTKVLHHQLERSIVTIILAQPITT